MVVAHVLEHPEKGLFISRHSGRGSVFEEIERLRGNKYVVNPKESLGAWAEFLIPKADELERCPLLHTAIFVRNTRHKAFAAVLGSLPDRIIEHSLWRDQILLPYHMQHDYGMIGILDSEGALCLSPLRAACAH